MEQCLGHESGSDFCRIGCRAEMPIVPSSLEEGSCNLEDQLVTALALSSAEQGTSVLSNVSHMGSVVVRRHEVEISDDLPSNCHHVPMTIEAVISPFLSGPPDLNGAISLDLESQGSLTDVDSHRNADLEVFDHVEGLQVHK
jgi:hypothetical protein